MISDPRLRIIRKFSLSLILGVAGYLINRELFPYTYCGIPFKLGLGGVLPILTAFAWGPVFSFPVALITSFSFRSLPGVTGGTFLYLYLTNILWVYLVGRVEEKRKWSDGYTLSVYILLLIFSFVNIPGYLFLYGRLAPELINWKQLILLSYRDNISHFTNLNLAFILFLLPPFRRLFTLEKLPPKKIRRGYWFILFTIAGLFSLAFYSWAMQFHIEGIRTRIGDLFVANLLNLNFLTLLAIVIYQNWDMQSDITKKIAERGDILVTLLSNISESILIMDEDWKIRFANRAAFKLGPYNRRDLGVRIDRIVTLHSAETGDPLSHTVVIDAITSGKPFTCLLARKDGTFLRILISLSALPESRYGYAYLSLIRDITEEYEQEKRDIHRQKQEAIGRLVGGVAHDFNNRLAGIMGFAQLILQEEDPEQIAWFAHQIVDSAQSAADLTAQLLTLSRKQPMQHRTLSVNEMLLGMLSVCKHTISKGVEIRYLCGDDDLMIRGDKSLLENALLNLAINGADAMENRGVLTFQVAPFRVDNFYAMRSKADLTPGLHVRISVNDTGSGIPADLQEKVFDPFFTTKQEGKGTGLGLSSVKEIAEKHRGEISLVSTPGQGSTFIILLPLVQEEERA